MGRLNRKEALEFIERHRTTLDQQRNPFASREWLSLFVEQFGGEVYWGQELGDAVLLMEETREGLRLLANYYSSLATPVMALAAQPADAVSRFLTTTRADIAIFQPIAEEGVELFRTAGWFAKRYACFDNCYLPCCGLGFDNYIAGRRSQIAKAWARRAKFSGTIEITSDTSAISAYQEVYTRSWKQPEPYPDFIPSWAHVCAKAGWLRMGIARVDRQPVAAQFWFVRHGVAHIYKIAYDEAFKKLGAGTLLTAHLMQHVLDVDQAVEVDFGQGAEPHKMLWMTHTRPRVGVVMCRLGSARGLARAAYEWAGRTVQRWWRKVRLISPATRAGGTSKR